MKILFADDEHNIRNLLTDEMQRLGHIVFPCADGTEAVAVLQDREFDVLLLDLDMPGVNGIGVIEQARKLNSAADIVILTGKGTLEAAQHAIHFGVTEFLTKPYTIADLERVLVEIETKRRVDHVSGKNVSGKDVSDKNVSGKDVSDRALARVTDNDSARAKAPPLTESSTPNIIGNSAVMQNVHHLIERVAPTDSTVVILGDTGTGKELVARSIHQHSKRNDKLFVAVNCGALPENLIESELFGHRKGSFTGAETNRTGLLEVADGGTLFLDEIGELPKGVQAKFLRFLECGEVRKVGDNTATVCDVRVVCATLQNLEDMVKAGTFREDLWFRINTFEIHIPSLKERKDDLPELILFLAKRCRNKLSFKNAADIFTPEAYSALLQYDYPGNVRQLANTIEHALVLSENLPIPLDALPPQIRNGYLATVEATKLAIGKMPVRHQESQAKERPVITSVDTGLTTDIALPFRHNTAEVAPPAVISLRDLEMQAIESALQRHGGNKTSAAEELGISLKTLYNKLNQTERKSA